MRYIRVIMYNDKKKIPHNHQVFGEFLLVRVTGLEPFPQGVILLMFMRKNMAAAKLLPNYTPLKKSIIFLPLSSMSDCEM